jgi:hypothetical protein
MEAFLFGDTVPEILKHRAIRAWARARVRSRFAGREKKLTESDLATGEEEFARSEIETLGSLGNDNAHQASTDCAVIREDADAVVAKEVEES